MRILIVEDSPTLADALYASLAREGYACDHAGDGVSAAAYTAQYDYDILVLDWMLPRREGIDILRELREGGAQTRVLMLSARDQVVDRVMALDAGADDYLGASCHPQTSEPTQSLPTEGGRSVSECGTRPAETASWTRREYVSRCC